MPEHFTKDQRKMIREELLKTAEEFFTRYGVKKTNIQEITAQVGIAKGSFYRFFPSKEELFLTVIERVEAREREKLQKEMNSLRLSPGALIIWFLNKSFQVVEENPFFKRSFNDMEDMKQVLRKVGPERFAQHTRLDDEYLLDIIKKWQGSAVLKQEDPALIATLMKSLYYLVLHKEEIGPNFEAVFQRLIELVAGDIAGDGG